MKQLLILTAYDGKFAVRLNGSKEHHTDGSMDVAKLAGLFRAQGMTVETAEFAGVDLSRDWRGWYVIYASREDNGFFYKGYIEDVLLALQEAGAVLIPDFTAFRAHSDKALQELLRRGFRDEMLRTPSAVAIGELSELDRVKGQVRYPAVVKIAGGSGSRGVAMVKNEQELRETAVRFMAHTYHDFSNTRRLRLGLFGKRLLRRITGRRVGNEVLFPKEYTNKIIIEEFVPGLTGDYKVLYFGGKYYCLHRLNREDDFRASGSGRFVYPETVEEVRPVLDLARRAAEEFGLPLMSLDIGRNEERCYLLEYQFVFFGPYTLQYSTHYFTFENGDWTRVDAASDLEEEFTAAVGRFIQNGGRGNKRGNNLM